MKIIRHIKHIATLMSLPKNQRRIIFYSEGKSYWVHLEGILKEFLNHSNIPVCYVTSGADDPGLAFQHKNLTNFKIDEGWIRNWFFANVDTDVFVMTMPDLGKYQVKRSKFPVHYVYVQHSLVSQQMAYRKGAFDHFDTIFCAGPHHKKEIRAMEEIYHLSPKNILDHGYGRLDAILAKRKHIEVVEHNIPRILVAPSWGENGLIETRGEEVVSQLLADNYRVTLRPHPQTTKFSKAKLDAINKKHHHNPNFVLELDVASQDSLHNSDLMISDWSGAALDYAFGLEKPVLFVDVPMKINNPQYMDIPLIPFEISIREKIGAIVPIKDIPQLDEYIKKIMRTNWVTDLKNLREEHVYNVGSSAIVGADALMALLK